MVACLLLVLAVVNCNLALGQLNPARPPPVDVPQLDRYFDVETDPDDFFGDMSTRKRAITLTVVTGKTKPEALAVFVGRGEEQKNPDNSPAKWIPYTDKLTVDLGEGDGKRQIFVAARWKATDKGYDGTGFEVTVRRARTKPTIVITSPGERITSKPIIQLKGYSPTPLDRISYEVFEQTGKEPFDHGEGFVTDQKFDRDDFNFTTHYFQCYDIELRPGTNIIRLRCEDEAGIASTTNLVFVFTTAGDTDPPHFVAVDWPQPDAVISGDSFTLRGRVDDDTARMEGVIVANGRTNSISGFPERNGCFWYEEIPLGPGANLLTLTATDAAGNSSRTNLTVYGVEGPVITLDPIVPAEKLWQPRIAVTGKVRPANCRVWINGVEAKVKSDGAWSAESVPVKSPNGGGVATFEMSAVPVEANTNQVAQPASLVYAQTSLGSAITVLNASSPACGIFKLHLDGINGRSFVLQASTNLVDWTSLFTNSSPKGSFDYTDSNVNKYPCRFFRVVPLE